MILPDDTATATTTTIPIRAEPGLPLSYDPIVNAENEVEAAFDGLTDTGALSSRNHMAIENLHQQYSRRIGLRVRLSIILELDLELTMSWVIVSGE